MATRVLKYGWQLSLIPSAADIIANMSLDMLAKASPYIAANPSDYTGLLNKTVQASVNGETMEFEIIDLARYDKSDGSGKAGVVLMAKTLLDNVIMTMLANGTPLSSGWAGSAVRSYINNIQRPSQAVEVLIPYNIERFPSQAYFSADYMFIPSYGEFTTYNSDLTGTRFSGLTGDSSELLRGDSTNYWLRSISSNTDNYWSYVGSWYGTPSLADGKPYADNKKILPCFSI